VSTAIWGVDPRRAAIEEQIRRLQNLVRSALPGGSLDRFVFNPVSGAEINVNQTAQARDDLERRIAAIEREVAQRQRRRKELIS
jgi:hypothetical protein